MSPPGFEPAVDATIESSPRAPSVARRAVEQLAGVLDPRVMHDAQLLISELVTNSIKHSGSDDPIRVRIWARRRGLKAEVADGGFGFNGGARPSRDDEEGGRGLLILDAVADRWGIGGDMHGRVWFELWPRPVSRSA